MNYLGKERLASFIDAVLAIIMTILVLDLEKPKTMTWGGLWDLRAHFFAYALSFFWLGLMWSTQHSNWHSVKKISNSTVMFSLLMLFMASLFPYTTSLVANNFHNSLAQSLYGIVVLGVSLSNMAVSHSLKVIDPQVNFGWLYNLSNTSVFADLLVKLIGLLLALTVYPPAMVYAIFIAIIIVGVASYYPNRS